MLNGNPYENVTIKRCGRCPEPAPRIDAQGHPIPPGVGTFTQVNHIRVFRGAYWHHGVDLGDGTVVDYSGEPLRKFDARIERRPLSAFLQGGKRRVVFHPYRFDDATAKARALERVGERAYDLLDNNCEHFSSWALTGYGLSYQAEFARDLARRIGVPL